MKGILSLGPTGSGDGEGPFGEPFAGCRLILETKLSPLDSGANAAFRGEFSFIGFLPPQAPKPLNTEEGKPA